MDTGSQSLEPSVVLDVSEDVSYIATKLGVEVDAVADIKTDILLKLKLKFDEFDTINSQKLVLETNLEQLNHVSGKKFEILKNKLNKVTLENGNLQQSINSMKDLQLECDTKLSSMEIDKNLFNKQLLEKEDLISTLEKEKIHSFEIIKRRDDELTNLKTELDQMSLKNKDLRRELLELETTTQKSSSEILKLKFDKNNLTQELEILKKNSSWYETELNKKMEELKNFKMDKYKEFSNLQSDLETTKSHSQTLQSKYDNLKQNFESTSKKLDDSLMTIKKLNDKIAYSQEDFLKEMSSKDRLIEILTKSNDERKERVQFLQESLDSLKTINVNDSSDLKIQLDQANEKIAISTLKIQHLESTIDELTSNQGVTNFDASMISQLGSVPLTPKIFRQLQQHQQTLSPSAQQTLAKIGGGISLTQLYSDFQLLKKQLIKERRLKENLEKQVNQFVDELNRQVPAISATKERCSILELELTDISILLEKTSKEKDQFARENRNWRKKLSEYELELNTLNKSKIDLSRQISHLVIQLQLRLDNDSPLTAQEQDFVDKLVVDHVQGYNDESDTDKLITDRLVTFKSVVELTTRNQELLKITRQLGNQLEEQEKLSKDKMDRLESIAIDEAREAIIVLQEQISSVESQLNSVTRERDMFRSIAGGHKQHQQPNVFNSTPNTSAIDFKELNEKQQNSAVELLQTQEEFKVYKKETDATIKTLNKQNNELSQAKSDLAVQLAKAISTSQLFEERNKSLQETLKYSKSELDEIRKRSNMLQDNLSKHDIANRQLTEELIQLKSISESLHLEISNLKLEKQLWKSIEKRLNEENASLMDERLRLNNLTSDLQRLENEREKNSNDSTSRLNSTIAGLEEELGSLKSKLDANTEELRSLFLRKDADAKAYQERIDSLRDELSTAKEDLIKRKTLTDQLEQSVEQLKRQLASTEQQLQAYESTDDLDSELNVELKLRQDLQKTKLDLQNALNDLNEANESVEQFKSVASAAESRVVELTASYDEYKTSIESKLSESSELNENLTKEVSQLNGNISTLQKELSDLKMENGNVIDSLNKDIETLTARASSADEIRAEYQQKIDLIKADLDQQYQITSDRQKSYEQELQKHAEVTRINMKLREDESALKIQIQQLTVEARDSKTLLITSKESWESQKLSLQEELKAAEGRVSDLNLQNRMLLNQLEQLTKQQREGFSDLSKLDTANMEGSSEELMQVISFLRHEKEISDAQLEVAEQEQRRLQQNLEITKQDLEDIRAEYIKLQTQNEHSEKLEQNYKELTEKVNQLDILRESNNTLRQESQRYAITVKELEQKLSTNAAKLEPLEFQVVNLKLELDTKTKELESEKTIVEFWKNKNQEILQNYNRIDPEEHQLLKLKVEELTPSANQVEELKTQLTNLETSYQTERKKSIREANDRLTKFKGIIDVTKKELVEEKLKTAELQQQIETLQKSLEDNPQATSASPDIVASLTKELEELKQLLSSANEEREKALAQMTESRDELQKQVDELQKKLNTSTTSTPDIEALRASFENEKLELIKQKDAELEQQKFKLKIEIKRELEGQKGAASTPDIEALKKELEAEHAKDVETKVKEACDALKAKIREPHEAKINAIVNKRFEKLKLEAEVEIKRKEEELAKSYQDKLQSSSNDQDLQKEITALKESIELECKKAKEEGRLSALKENEMRYKMTKRQLDKAKETIASLKGETASSATSSLPLTLPLLASNPLPSSVPVKPVLASNSNNSNSRIPTLKKPQILKPQAEDDNKQLKRSADDVANSEESAEKKLKNE